MPYNINQAESGTLTPMASDNVGGQEYPKMKPTWGADGVVNAITRSTPMPVEISPVTDNGLTPHYKISAASTNATSVHAGATKLYKAQLFNASGATKYFKLFDKASAPSLGTDNPVNTFPLEAGKNMPLDFAGIGLAFASGLAYAITGGLADNDATSVAANDVVVNLFYK